MPAAKSGADYEVCAHEQLPSNNKLRNYSFCYDNSKHCALWVAYPLHSCYLGSAKRDDCEDWEYDPCCIKNANEPRLNKSYTSSKHDRGHQLPFADRKASVADGKTTFYFTNMTPQHSDLNQKSWNELEGSVRNMICSDTLYVVTGAHFDGSSSSSTTDNDGMSCPLPTHYYKVLLRTKNGNTGKRVHNCSANELQCIGYWVKHDGTSAIQTKSVKEIEDLTGFTFFANVPNAPKSTYNILQW